MRLPKALLGAVTVAGVIAAVGALLTSPWLLGVGSIVAFTGLAAFSIFGRPASSRRSRTLLRAGLLACALSLVFITGNLVAWQSDLRSASIADLIAYGHDWVHLHARVPLLAGAAASQVLACVMFGFALVRERSHLPRSATIGFALLVLNSAASAASAISAWRLEPGPPPVLPPGLPPDVLVSSSPDHTAATLSVTLGLDPVSALTTAAVIVASYLIVNGCAAHPSPPADSHRPYTDPV